MLLLTVVTFILLLVSHIFVYLTIQKKTTTKSLSFFILYIALACPLVFTLLYERSNDMVGANIELGIAFLFTWAAIIVMCAVGFFRFIKKHMKQDEI
ncbi:hypothetical protein [Brevibacillus borstelensis]|uniref:hypothetical protein n=1 Tax=Brevibacillus borstelensis TaxID=45462 RepID=UPI001FAA1D74|nr:hypothetical protein [Brevibacillus borstelensis]